MPEREHTYTIATRDRRGIGGPTPGLRNLLHDCPVCDPTETVFIFMHEPNSEERIPLYRWHNGRSAWLWVGRGREPIREQLPYLPHNSPPLDDDDIPF